MHFRTLLFILLFIASTAFAKEPIRVFDSTVLRVSDGDTLVVDDGGIKAKIRLYGVDAPETPKISKKGKLIKPGQPYGVEAYQALQEKISGKQVHLEVIDIDSQYNRLVAILSMDGRNINKEMVAEGWAWAYRQYLHRPYKSDFIESEDAARTAGIGLWQQSNPQPPWEFRKQFKKTKRKKHRR